MVFHKTFELKGEVEYLDVQKSMKRLLNYNVDGSMKNPWLVDRIQGLTGHSKFVVRYVETDTGTLKLRPLLAAERFALQGWFSDGLRVPTQFAHPLLPASLTDNVFSAYHIGPMLMATLACGGAFGRRVGPRPAKRAQRPPPVEVVSDDEDV